MKRTGNIAQVKEYGLNNKKFEITKQYEQMKQPKEKRQPYQDSLKRNIIRDYFLRSKGIRNCLRQDLR